MSTSTVSKLEELKGLGSAKRLVRRMCSGGAGAHAVLFYGSPGSGTDRLAELLAEAWLCREPNSDGACGACKACSAFSRDHSADLLRIAPGGLGNFIKVNQITPVSPSKPEDPIPLTSFFRTLPITGKNRVAIIQDAHRMNASASNSLLKTLEEPHPAAKLILTTPAVGGVAPTILSRCLAVPCELPPEAELRELVPDAADVVIRFAGGSPGRVDEAARIAESLHRLVVLAEELRQSPPGAALAYSERLKEIAESIGATLDVGARAGNARALELLATYFSREPDIPPSWTNHALDAHRSVIGNASSGIVFDAMFSRMLGEPRT